MGKSKRKTIYCNGKRRGVKGKKMKPGPWAGEGYCHMPAGMGTKHKGEGRCKFHGGCTNGRPIIHGLYSKYTRFVKAEDYSAALADKEIKRLREEIAVCRGALMKVLADEQFDGEKLKDIHKLSLIIQITNNIGKLVAKAAMIEDGMKVVKTHIIQVQTTRLLIAALDAKLHLDLPPDQMKKEIVGYLINGFKKLEEKEK